jgi:hypothetical protein
VNEQLRDRILRKMETLSDERAYQVLDYVDFLEARYATRPEAPIGIFAKFAETVEDTMRAGRVSATAISETMSLMNKAMGVLGGVAAAGKSVATDFVGAAQKAASAAGTAVNAAGSAVSAAAAGTASTPAGPATAPAAPATTTAAKSDATVAPEPDAPARGGAT